jgi:hypothetical protein
VLAQQLEHDRLADRDEGDRAEEHALIPVGELRVEEAQAERDREGEREQYSIRPELEHPAPVDRIEASQA